MAEAKQEFSLKRLFVPLTTLKSIFIIAISGFTVYFNSLFGNFVWDDKIFILYNNDTNIENIGKVFNVNRTFNSEGAFRPIYGLYLIILKFLFHDQTFYYHFAQVSLHIAVACLLYIFFKTFLQKKFALILSLIFLIHPINVESVAYISTVHGEIYSLLCLTALLISRSAKKYWQYLLVTCLLLLALLTKETTVLFLLMILVWQILFAQRNIIKYLFIEAVAILGYFALRYEFGSTQITKNNITPIAQLTLPERLINIPAIILFYIKTFFFPKDLAIEQNWVVKNLNFHYFYFPLIIDASFFLFLILCGIYIYKTNKNRFKLFLFFFIWFSAGLFIHLQITPLDMTVAERFFYSPIIGLLGMIGIVLQYLNLQHKNIKTAFTVTSVVVITLLSLRTIVRNSNWFDPVTLYSHDIQINDYFDIEDNLGSELTSMKQLPEAIIHLKRSVELFPYERNLYNLGSAYMIMGDAKNAKASYNRALSAKNYNLVGHNHDVQVYTQFAKLLILSNENNEAKRIINEGLEDYPQDSQLWSYLAISEHNSHNQIGALKAAEKAKTLMPNEETDELYKRILNSRLNKLVLRPRYV